MNTTCMQLGSRVTRRRPWSLGDGAVQRAPDACFARTSADVSRAPLSACPRSNRGEPPVEVRIPCLRITCLAAALLALLPCSATAESFRFAGSLSDAGAPANGHHALRVVA